MHSRFLRKAAGFAPPGLRRTISGLVLDLRSLPARLSDPSRRGEPWSTLHNVGNGDYRTVGLGILEDLRQHAALAPGESVLDIGCGTGRAAGPVMEFLGPAGRYVGFDVSRAAIEICRRRFAADSRLHFVWMDVRNGDYNPKGQISEQTISFPALNSSVDVAFATSVFTHMQMGTVEHYLRQVARVLRPGGRFLFTSFALGPGRLSSEAFPFVPFDDDSAVIDRRSPERAIAHSAEATARAIAAAGLDLCTLRRGAWAPRSDHEGGQDIWVVRKPNGFPAERISDATEGLLSPVT